MVKIIYLMVRNIVFILLIAVFLEMLLPLKEMRRFLEVVVGLFVLITVLNPIVSLIHQEPHLKMQLQEGNERELQEILDRGKNLQQWQAAQAQKSCGKRMEEQVAVMAQLVPGVEKAEAKVHFAAGSSLENTGAIEKVEIALTTTANKKSIVDPVERISIDSQNDEARNGVQAAQTEVSNQRLLDRVQTTVASLYGLQLSKVVVTLQ